MKKVLLGALIASATVLATTAVNAAVTLDSADLKPYVGLDYNFLGGFEKVGLDDVGGDKVLDGNVNVLGVSFGVQLNDYVGIEASYGKGVSNIDGQSFTYAYSQPGTPFSGYTRQVGETKFEHLTLGLTGQYPIADQVYVKGLVGAAWQRFEVDGFTELEFYEGEVVHEYISNQKRLSNNEAAFLAKVGLGYQASENSVFEANYTREGKLDGIGLQYKYVF